LSRAERDLDLPTPLLAAAQLVPLYAVVGFRTARDRDLYHAARAGAETAALAFATVCLAAATFAGLRELREKPFLAAPFQALGVIRWEPLFYGVLACGGLFIGARRWLGRFGV
jgi:hypothetical protein